VNKPAGFLRTNIERYLTTVMAPSK